MKHWSTEEDKILKEKHLDYTRPQLTEFLPGRTAKSIMHRLVNLGLAKEQKRWSIEEDKILLENYLKMSNPELVKLLPGRTVDSINVRANKTYNLRKDPLWSQEQLELLKNKDELTSCKELGDQIGKSEWCMYQMARKLGVETHANRKRKYAINIDFFSKPNLLNCYHAGWLAADGCVFTDNSDSKIRMALKDCDIEVLEQLKKDCDWEGAIKIGDNSGFIIKSDGTREKFNKVAIFETSCYKWVKDLEKNFNIGPRKSLTLIPPPLTDLELQLSYISGYIEGDGHFRFYNKERRGYTYRTPVIGIVGTYELLAWIKQIFDENFPNVFNRSHGKQITRQTRFVLENKNIWNYNLWGTKTAYILRRLYELKIPKLSRKFNPVFIKELYEYIQKFENKLNIPPLPAL